MSERATSSSLLSVFGPAALSSLAASGLGFLFWVIAAHYYTPQQIGFSGSVISLVSGIGIAASGALYAILIRTLSVHDRPRILLWTTCAVVALIGGVLGALAGMLHLSRAQLPSTVVTLALAAAVWSLFVLQDSILISLRKTTALFISNVGFGVVKLVLMVALAESTFGILVAWALPLLVVVPAVALVADRSVAALSPAETATLRVTRQQIGAESVASLFFVVAFAGTPVIVSLVRGGSFAGIVYVCWTIFMAADSVGIILSNAVVSNTTERRLDAVSAVRTARSAMPAIFGLLLLGAVLAPVALGIFGATYQQASSLLRLLLLAVMIRVIGHLALGVRRVNLEFWHVAVAQGACAAVLSVGVALAAANGSLAWVGISVVLSSAALLAVGFSPPVLAGLRRVPDQEG